MIKKALFLALIASCTAWAQRADTPATVRQILGAGGSSAASQAAPPPPARVEVSAAVPGPITSTSAAPSAAPVPVEVLGTVHSRAGKRDPFVSPVTPSSAMNAGPGAGCASGKKCLVIDQLVLRGVVKTATGMIAVVANTANKAYFLRENDPVFNGYVIRITPDSVVFKENTLDAAGRHGTREIVKKVNAPSA